MSSLNLSLSHTHTHTHIHALFAFFPPFITSQTSFGLGRLALLVRLLVAPLGFLLLELVPLYKRMTRKKKEREEEEDEEEEEEEEEDK